MHKFCHNRAQTLGDSSSSPQIVGTESATTTSSNSSEYNSESQVSTNNREAKMQLLSTGSMSPSRISSPRRRTPLDDINADQLSFATQPPHDIMECRRRWRRVIKDTTQYEIVSHALRGIKDVQTQLEPPVHVGANVRADISHTWGTNMATRRGHSPPCQCWLDSKKSNVRLARSSWTNLFTTASCTGSTMAWHGRAIPSASKKTAGRFDKAAWTQIWELIWERDGRDLFH